MLAACSGLNEFDPEKNVHSEEGELVEQVVFEVPAIRFLGEDGSTRASLSQEQEAPEDIIFGWEAEDTVGIYPNKGAQVYFSMAGGIGTNVAIFDGGGWALRENSTYSCYYPFVGDMYLKPNAIPVSFAGQEFTPTSQEQTDEQASLPKYQGVRFSLASTGNSTSSGSLRFTFQMLNTVIRIKAFGLPEGTYTKLSLSTDEPLFVQKGSFGLESMEIAGETFSNSLEVSLKDFTLTESSSEDNPALIYLSAAPVDLRGKTLTVKIYSSDGTAYQCEKHPGIAYEANSWVGLPCDLVKESVIFYTSSDNRAVIPADNAFGDATLVSNTYDGSKGILVFDKDVTVIGDHAFEGCTTLTGITIPETVTSIGDFAFSGCSNLGADNMSANMTRMMYSMRAPSRSGDPSFVIPESVTSIGAFAFKNCSSLTSIVIPDNVTSIGEGAFQGCTNLSDVTIPEIDATMIHSVFDGAGITSVTIAEGVTSIADHAFERCTNLIRVTIPNSVEYIGASAFEDCPALIDIEIPERVGFIGEGAFRGCVNLPRINLPLSTTIIQNFTFAGCNALAEINIPSGLQRIGDSAFDCCHHLPNIVLPNTVTYIGTFAFGSCRSFTTFSIPPEVREIKYGTFNDCINLTSVSIHDEVEVIEEDAFTSCPALSSIVIPESVTNIRSGAFSGCTGLSYITIHAATPPEELTASTFENTNNCLIYVPSESLEAYKTTEGWNNYADRICDHVYVDMGNGMKWATTNVGAIGPDDLGQYFAWGRTTPIVSPDEDYDYDVLYTDAAHAIWGGNWRMPTAEEWSALMQETNYTWNWDPIRKGHTVKSLETGNTIFLPAAGNVGEHGIGSVGFEGDYWSSALYDPEPHDGISLSLDQYNGACIGGWGRSAGLSVRPIYQAEPLGDMETVNDSREEIEL